MNARLRDAGVDPAPSEAQIGYVETLLEDLQLDDEEREEVLGAEGVEGIRTTARASRVLNEGALDRLTGGRPPMGGHRKERRSYLHPRRQRQPRRGWVKN